VTRRSGRFALRVDEDSANGAYLPGLRDPVLEAARGGSAFGGLPMTPLSGQILNAGHFSQPATMAIGHSVMANLRCAVLALMQSPAREPE
jgi:hypothetical protein